LQRSSLAPLNNQLNMTHNNNGNGSNTSNSSKSTTPVHATPEEIKKIDSMIKDIKAAMLTTMEDDGTHRSRPMWTIGREFDGRIYFFTDVNSAKAYEVRKFPSINLSYADPGGQNYVSITGTCKVITDRGLIRELFKPMHKTWYPKVRMIQIFAHSRSPPIMRSIGIRRADSSQLQLEWPRHF
jgi:general stress protein 26